MDNLYDYQPGEHMSDKKSGIGILLLSVVVSLIMLLTSAVYLLETNEHTVVTTNVSVEE